MGQRVLPGQKRLAALQPAGAAKVKGRVWPIGAKAWRRSSQRVLVKKNLLKVAVCFVFLAKKFYAFICQIYHIRQQVFKAVCMVCKVLRQILVCSFFAFTKGSK
jgi:hypothetical protein